MHARGSAPLCFTVGDAGPCHRDQSGRLRTRRCRRVGRQVEAGGLTAPVEDGHPHEGHTSSTVDDGQDKSETEVRGEDQAFRSGKPKETKCITEIFTHYV